MACYNINRFYFCVMLLWMLSKCVTVLMLFPIFSNYVPKWRCLNSTNVEFSKNCSTISTCKNGVEFEKIYFQSSALEFNWFCGENSYYASFYTQLQFIGTLIGTMIYGSLADVLGRKPISILCVVGAFASALFTGLAPNWQLLLVSRFLVGFSIGGVVSVGTLCMEHILPRQRIVMRGLCNWGIARLIMTLICYAFPNWRHASLAFSPIYLAMLLLIVFVIPESPTWLHSKGRLDKMHKVERKIAKFSGVEYNKRDVEEYPESESILHLLRNPALFKRLSILWFMYFTAALCSYGNDFNSSSISGHLFLNQIVFSVCIAISKFFLVFVDTRFASFSRRRLHQWSQLAVILCFLVLIFLLVVYEKSYWILIINVIGTIFIEYTWDGCFLSAIESIPTNFRASATGSCTLIARIGGTVAPLFFHLNQIWAFSTYTLVSILGCLNLAVSYFWLIETKGVTLDDVKLDKEKKLKATPEVLELLENKTN